MTGLLAPEGTSASCPATIGALLDDPSGQPPSARPGYLRAAELFDLTTRNARLEDIYDTVADSVHLAHVRSPSRTLGRVAMITVPGDDHVPRTGLVRLSGVFARFAGRRPSTGARSRGSVVRASRPETAPPQTRPLAILIVTSEAPPVISGISTAVAVLRRGLTDQGHHRRRRQS